MLRKKTNVSKIYYKRGKRQADLAQGPGDVGLPCIVKAQGCLTESLNLTPKGERSGCGSSFI